MPLALKLAHQSPCEPKTLNRAAGDYLGENPKFALGVAIASLHWIIGGWGYEITGSDVYSAYEYAMKAAESLDIVDQAKALKSFCGVLKQYYFIILLTEPRNHDMLI